MFEIKDQYHKVSNIIADKSSRMRICNPVGENMFCITLKNTFKIIYGLGLFIVLMVQEFRLVFVYSLDRANTGML